MNVTRKFCFQHVNLFNSTNISRHLSVAGEGAFAILFTNAEYTKSKCQFRSLMQSQSSVLKTYTSKFDGGRSLCQVSNKLLNQMESDEEHLKDLEDTYINRVTLMGDVCYTPFAIHREEEVVGYKFTVVTKSKSFSVAANSNFIKYTRHSAVCWKRRSFPLIENKMKINSRVFIEGYLQVYTPNKPLMEKSERKVDIVVTKLEILPEKEEVEQIDSEEELSASVWD